MYSKSRRAILICKQIHFCLKTYLKDRFYDKKNRLLKYVYTLIINKLIEDQGKS